MREIIVCSLLLIALVTGCKREDVGCSRTFEDLAPTDVLVSVDGHGLTLADLNERVSFETALYRAKTKMSEDDVRLVTYRTSRERSAIADFVIREAVVKEAKRLGIDVKDSELESDSAFLCQMFGLSKSLRGKELYKRVGVIVGIGTETIERFMRVNALTRTVMTSDTVCGRVSQIEERQVDEAIQRIKDVNAASLASNRLAQAKLENALKAIRAGRDFTEVGEATDELNDRHATFWGAFSYQDLREIETDGGALADWAFRKGTPGSVSDRIYQLDDGASLVKLISREDGALEESEAAEAVASVRLARMTVLMRDELAVPKRDDVHKALYEEALRKVRSDFNKNAVARCSIEYPCGTNLWPEVKSPTKE